MALLGPLIRQVMVAPAAAVLKTPLNMMAVQELRNKVILEEQDIHLQAMLIYMATQLVAVAVPEQLAQVQVAHSQVLAVPEKFQRLQEVLMPAAVVVDVMAAAPLQHVSMVLEVWEAEEQAMDQMELQLEWLEHLELQTLAVAVVVPETQVVITAKVAMVDQV